MSVAFTGTAPDSPGLSPAVLRSPLHTSQTALSSMDEPPPRPVALTPSVVDALHVRPVSFVVGAPAGESTVDDMPPPPPYEAPSISTTDLLQDIPPPPPVDIGTHELDVVKPDAAPADVVVKAEPVAEGVAEVKPRPKPQPPPRIVTKIDTGAATAGAEHDEYGCFIQLIDAAPATLDVAPKPAPPKPDVAKRPPVLAKPAKP